MTQAEFAAAARIDLSDVRALERGDIAASARIQDIVEDIEATGSLAISGMMINDGVPSAHEDSPQVPRPGFLSEPCGAPTNEGVQGRQSRANQSIPAPPAEGVVIRTIPEAEPLPLSEPHEGARNCRFSEAVWQERAARREGDDRFTSK